MIYCHWDGYPAHVGKLLLENYTDIKKIRKLVSMGSVSSLGKEIDIPEGVTHNFENRVKDITTFYHRDRGEEKSPIIKYPLSKSLPYVTDQIDGSYGYVYDTTEKKWYFCHYAAEKEMELTAADCVEKQYV